MGDYETGGIKFGTGSWGEAEKVALLSTVGGTASQLSGGSFTNGALSTAYQLMFNAIAHTAAEQQSSPRPRTKQPITLINQCVIQGKSTGNLNSGKQGALPGITVGAGNVAIDPRVLGLPGGKQSTNLLLAQYGPQTTVSYSPPPELPQGFPTIFTVGDVVGPESAREENPPIFDINGLPNVQAAYNVTGLRTVTITYPATAPFTCNGSSGGFSGGN